MKLCNQCNRRKPPAEFTGRLPAHEYQDCRKCRAKYSGWSRKSLADKLAVRGPREPEASSGLVHWIARSHNRKLGPIPSTMSDRGTCPPTCGLYDAGCYADYGKLGDHWRKVADRGITWPDLLSRVRALPSGQLWRHNVAGDLVGDGATIDGDTLRELVDANEGRRGFTFTHYPMGAANAGAVLEANRRGFTVNVSTDTLDDADRAPASVPVVTLLAHDAPKQLRTPGGRRVVLCLAEATPGVTCEDCRLCAQPQRKAIVGFRAHGQFAKRVPELVQLRRRTTP